MCEECNGYTDGDSNSNSNSNSDSDIVGVEVQYAKPGIEQNTIVITII